MGSESSPWPAVSRYEVSMTELVILLVLLVLLVLLEVRVQLLVEWNDQKVY